MKRKLIIIGVLALFLSGCATIDIILDSRFKTLHAAQLEFKDTLNRYTASFYRQDPETQTWMREKVSPLIILADEALQAWESVVMNNLPDTGQQDAWIEAKNNLLFTLKPFLVEE